MPSWEEIAEWANSIMGTWIGRALLMLLEFLQNEIFVPITSAVLGFGVDMHNGFVGSALNMLTESPSEWNEAGWSFIFNMVNPIFVIFGCSLVTIFFLIGFLGELNDDTKSAPSFWRIIMLFLKIFIAQFMVISCIDIVIGLFGYVEALTDFSSGDGETRYVYSLPQIEASTYDFDIGAIIPGTENDEDDKFISVVPVTYEMNEWLAMVMEADYEYDEYENITTNRLSHFAKDGWQYNMGFVPALFTTICAVLFMISCIVSGAVIAYTAYMRFFKIMLLTPYGSVACATIAGNHMLSQTAVQFFKYAICVVFEAVTMIVAIHLMNIVAPTIDFVKLEGEYYYCGILINQCFILFLCLGVVKGAYQITQKALGL